MITLLLILQVVLLSLSSIFVFLVDFSEVDVSPNDTVFLDKLNFIIRFYGFLCVKTAPSNIWGKFLKLLFSGKLQIFLTKTIDFKMMEMVACFNIDPL